MKRLVVALIAVVAVAAGCGSSSNSAQSSSAPLKKVTLMLDWTPNTNHSGIYLAQKRGYYAKAGLDVKIVQPGDQGSLPALSTGDADFAVSFQEELIPARQQGVPAVSIAALLSTNTSSLVSLTSEGITRPRDLEGKTYGGSGGPLEQQLVSNLVSCDGGDPSKVKFADVDTSNYQAGLQNHTYDFAWVYEGWEVLQLRQAGVAINTIPFSQHFDCIPDWYTPILATSQKMISNNPDTVRSFTQATAHGYEDAIKDPTAASDALLAAAPELDAKLVRASSTYLSKFYAAPGQPWGVQKQDIWASFEAYLLKAKVMDSSVDVTKAYTNDFLPKS